MRLSLAGGFCLVSGRSSAKPLPLWQRDKLTLMGNECELQHSDAGPTFPLRHSDRNMLPLDEKNAAHAVSKPAGAEDFSAQKPLNLR
jgi:hypothetical protein